MTLLMVRADRQGGEVPFYNGLRARQCIGFRSFYVELNERGCQALQTLIQRDRLHKYRTTSHRRQFCSGRVKSHRSVRGSAGLLEAGDLPPDGFRERRDSL